MEQLLEIRDRILTVYSQYEPYLCRVIRFAVCLLAVICINGQIGYEESLTGVLPTVLIALICTLLSGNYALVVLALVIVIHLLSLSLVAALTGGCLFLLLLLVYFRFAPEDSMLLLLYPVCSAVGVTYALPVAGGLIYGPTSGITVAAGVIAGRFLAFVKSSEAVLSSSGSDTDEIITSLQYLIDGVLSDRLMQVQVIAVIVGAAVVYVVRRRAIPYAWLIASAAGAVVQMVLLLVGAIVFDTDLAIVSAFLGVAAAFLIGAVISFVAFNLDYSRTENTQFEDDEYYYYVKAVPKVVYARPKRTVKTINTHRGQQEPGKHRGTAKRYYTDDEQAWNTEMFYPPDAGNASGEEYDGGGEAFADDGYGGGEEDFSGDVYGENGSEEGYGGDSGEYGGYEESFGSYGYNRRTDTDGYEDGYDDGGF